MSARGIFVVAFGDPARACALRLLASAKKHTPDVPVALCSAAPLGPEDVFVQAPDADVGGRRAKLRAYELVPAEWQAVVYLDADTELVAPIYQLFEWVENGWEFVICRDVGETLHSFQRKNNLRELAELKAAVGSLWAIQYNGGVWAFRRCETVRRFMARWRAEYEVHLQRDQGALIRALWAEPLRILTLEHTWNCFPKYTPYVKQAAINHYPEAARRWRGKLPGRIDSPEAWGIVRRWEASQK